jgi:phosphoglycolate phosphatase-like HAD superfamily hydrolase
MTQPTLAHSGRLAPGRTAFLFDLDGTLVDSVYQHVLAWHKALASVGIRLAVWTIHRRIGMSGGLMADAILRETGHTVCSGISMKSAFGPRRSNYSQLRKGSYS